MAYATVQELFTGICDAVRKKDGTTAEIQHQDIPQRILDIPNISNTIGIIKRNEVCPVASVAISIPTVTMTAEIQLASE